MTESANDARVVVRFGTDADAHRAAVLHCSAISEGFLAALGPRFLTHLYRRIVRSPDAFLLVADRDGTPVGFIAGALDLGALYRRFLLHDGVPAALSSLPRLLTSWRRAWETLRHGTGGGETRAELLSVAVDPSCRGRHLGSLLVDGFLAELTRRDASYAQVVVGADNTAAIALYRRSGFETDHSFELHRGTTSLVMRRSAGGGSARPDAGSGAGPGPGSA
jgi:ribosomal protein S18 acetylase RimI-like enzyme